MGEASGFRAVIRTRRRAAECGGFDADLVERAVRNVRPRRRGLPRWSAVKSAFGVGSSSAHALCRRFGLDPDAILDRNGREVSDG